MELFPATADDTWSLIKPEIDDSDYYVLILGGKYGSIDSHTGVGYTEQEFDYESDTGKRIIAFLHKDFNTLPKKKRETNPTRLTQLRRFHEKAKNRHHVIEGPWGVSILRPRSSGLEGRGVVGPERREKTSSRRSPR